MGMGRPTKGLGHIDSLDASESSKVRLTNVLLTLMGELSVLHASAAVGLQPARFGELRRRALQAAANALEPGRPGRPPLYDAEESKRIADLAGDNERLRRELETTRLQLQVAQEAPGVLQRAQKKGSRAKKPRRGRCRGRRA